MRNLFGLCVVVGMTASVGAYAIGLSSGRQGSAEASALAEAFRGITADGEVVSDLFTLRATGVSTAPVVAAASSFLEALEAEQLRDTTFTVDDIEWRRWNNVHRYERRGVEQMHGPGVLFPVIQEQRVRQYVQQLMLLAF